MHKIIVSIQWTKTKEEALENAKEFFDRLVRNEVYDYFVTFDEDSGTQTAGNGRWGDKEPAITSESEEGKELIEKFWNYTKEDFTRHFNVVKKDLLNKDPEDFLTGETDRFVLWHAYQLYGYSHNYYLYDRDGEPITDKKHLDNSLTKWGDPEKGEKCFLVQADVHF